MESIYKRFIAREEFFGFLIFDKQCGEVFISKYKELPKLLGSGKGISIKMGEELIDIENDQILLLDSKFRKNNILSAPTYVEIYPTLTCNERCKFCYVGHALKKEMTTMSKEAVDVTLTKLKDLGVFEISILGGEPFLYKHLDYWVLKFEYHLKSVSCPKPQLNYQLLYYLSGD